MRTKQKRSEPTPAKGRPKTPAHLTEEGRAAWDWLCEELDQMGTLFTSDRAIMSLYCQAWARMAKAEQRITDPGQGEIVLSPKQKTPMYNLWLAISNDASGQLYRYAKELGLTARSRAKMQVADEPDDDGFDLD